MTHQRRPAAIMLQWVALTSALVALPPDKFSPLWLGLFSLPGVVFLALSAIPKLAFSIRLGIAVALVLSLSFAIFQTGVRPVPQAALTYLLLPPLAYAALRSRPLDVLHSLFLALCLLIISSILSKDGLSLWIIGSFALAGASTLQFEARRMGNLERAIHGTRLHPLTRATQTTSVALACLCAFAGLHAILRSLPTPGERVVPAVPPAYNEVGISTEFDLGSGAGNPIRVGGGDLVEVRMAAPDPDLYLRCTYFDIAGIDRWDISPDRPLEDINRRSPYRRPRVGRIPVRTLELVRIDDEFGLFYAPPGTFFLDGEFSLRGSHEREEWFEPIPSGPLPYIARYQDLRALAYGRPAVRRDLTWTEVPGDIERRRDYRELAARYRREAGDDPTALAMVISRDLQRQSTYALEKPEGDSPHALDNFLFGNRRGYCMHFASALAMLLRLNDVPCRIALGLYGGRRVDGDENLRIFGSRDAHAWVEIPLAGLGWVPFDATPSATLRSNEALVPADGTGYDDDVLGDGDDSWWSSVLASDTSRSWWPWLGLLVLLAFAPRNPVRWRRDQREPAPREPHRRTARRMLLDILAALRKRGHTRPHGQSLERFAATLEVVDPGLASPLRAAFAAYQDVRFGGQALDEDRRSRLEAGLRAAR